VRLIPREMDSDSREKRCVMVEGDRWGEAGPYTVEPGECLVLAQCLDCNRDQLQRGTYWTIRGGKECLLRCEACGGKLEVLAVNGEAVT
jgi:hypothetical protein